LLTYYAQNYASIIGASLIMCWQKQAAHLDGKPHQKFFNVLSPMSMFDAKLTQLKEATNSYSQLQQ